MGVQFSSAPASLGGGIVATNMFTSIYLLLLFGLLLSGNRRRQCEITHCMKTA